MSNYNREQFDFAPSSVFKETPVGFKLSFKADEFCDWAKARANEQGWVTVDIMRSKDPKAKKPYYCKLNTWKPDRKPSTEVLGPAMKPPAPPEPDDMPF